MSFFYNLGPGLLKLPVWVQNPVEGRNFFLFTQGSIAHRLSLSPSHCPDMTEVL